MTSGFYKLEDGVLLYAPNYVLGPWDEYQLFKESKDAYNYPVDEWYWFDSESEAKYFFDIIDS